LETITTIRLIIVSEVLLPAADWMRRFTSRGRTESQVRFGLAFEVRVEDLVSDQRPIIAV
jgi:hypothetical protein